MRFLSFAALVVAGAAAVPAAAEIYDDKSLPFYVETAPGFPIRPFAMEGFTLALRIDATGNFPSRARGESYLCDILFNAVPVERTQGWINERWNDEVVASEVRRPWIAGLHVKSETPFEMGDVAGMEYVGPMRGNPSTVMMASVAVTPRGRLGMHCMLRAEQAEAALPMLRSIRATIRPPK